MRTKPVILLLCSLLFWATMASAAQLKIPEYKSFKLRNGLQVNVLKQSTVPLINFEMWIEAGAAMDSPATVGLASLTADALRKGAGERSAGEFAEELDFLGAEFGTSVNVDRVRISLELLAKDFDKGLELFADAVLAPQFPEEEIAKLVAQGADAVRQSKDSPGSVLRSYHYAHQCGAHPYGNPVSGTETSLEGLDSAAVRKFFSDHYGADRAVLTVAGDIDPRKVERALKRVFKKMKRAEVRRIEVTPLELPADNSVLLIDKPDTPQTWFCIGGLGQAWGADDSPAVMLVRTVFGGRFTSWLNTKLRIESGLTYGASFRLDNKRVGGPAYISSSTPTASTKEAIDLALAQLTRLNEDGLSDAELASAKAYLIGQLPYGYETASDHASTINAMQFYGVDREYVDGLLDAIAAVTQDDCRRVIGEYFRRDRLTLTAIGVASEIEEIMSGYGAVRVRDNAEVGFR
ncbi:MAG: insulinase family protein [bacterium]|nr:insulinase family protein [bacterium]